MRAEDGDTSEKSIDFHQTTQHYIAEDKNFEF